MKAHIVVFIVALVLTLSCSGANSTQGSKQLEQPKTPGNHKVTVEVGGTKRYYVAHLPAGYENRKSWPGGKLTLPAWIAGPKTTRLSATNVIWAFFQQHALPETN